MQVTPYLQINTDSMIFLFSAEMYNDERLWRGQTSCCKVEENKRLKGEKNF